MGAGASMVDSEQKAIEQAEDFLKRRTAQLWAILDYNGNNIVSVAETHKFIEDRHKEYPGLEVFIDSNTGKCRQPPLIRAWARVTGYIGRTRTYTEGHKDGYIHKHDFKRFMGYCFWYNRLYDVFTHLTTDDRRITLAEFKEEVPKVLKNTTPEDLEKAFKSMDTNGGGMLLFDEFCRYIIASVETHSMMEGVSFRTKETVGKKEDLQGLTDTHHAHIKESFDFVDVNKNHTLDLQEFRKAFGCYAEKAETEKPGDDAVDEIFTQFDVNGDGVVTLDEYAFIIHKNCIANK